MKVILISILLMFAGAKSYAVIADTTKQEKSLCADSVFFDGYYLLLYKKEDVNSEKMNRTRKMEGKSYKVPYESTPSSFFISKDSIVKRDFTNIINDLPKKNKKEVFIECTKDYAEMLGQEFCFKTESLKDCKFPDIKLDNKYFTTQNKNKYCFKICEISGWFIKLRVDTETKRDAIGKKLRYVAPNLNEFDAYFFVGSKTYSNTPGSLEKKIRLWKEVPPILD